MREKLLNYYQSHSIWLHFILFIVLFLSTYAFRHYLFLDDNLVLQSSPREIRTTEELEKGYMGVHIVWSFFNIASLFKLTYTSLFLAAFVSVFSKLKFKVVFKLALFTLFVFVLENLAYTTYYLLFPPEIIREMNVNVLSLQDFFQDDFLRFIFGQFSLFNLLYLILLAELLVWLSEQKGQAILIYLLVFAGFMLKILLGYFVF